VFLLLAGLHEIRAKNRLALVHLIAAMPDDLEQKLQSELYQPRVGPWRRGRDDSKIRIVRAATNGIGRRELGLIKKIEEFRAKLEAQTLVAGESNFFEHGKIKIIDSLRTLPGIDPRLVTKREICRGGKTRGIEPFSEPGSCAP